MGLSKHEGTDISIAEELEKLDEHLILLEGRQVKPSQCFRLSGNPPQVLYNTNCPEDLKVKVEKILARYRNREETHSYFYTIAFEFENTHYNGRLTPAFKKGNDLPSSWHVVLNEVFFGVLHKNHDRWEIAEQRPAALVEKVGSLIDKGAYKQQVL